jgi:esterase/lipase superfamily enzyme
VAQGDGASAFTLATTAAEIGGPAYSSAADTVRLRSCAEMLDASCEPVPVFFVTNREVQEEGASVRFANRLSPTRRLSFGLSLVSVPTAQLVEVAEKSTREIIFDYLAAPFRQWFSSAQRPNVGDAEVSTSLFDSALDEFIDQVHEAAEANDRKKIVVYVHGFANTFDDAARRLALFSEQFKYPGMPLLLSWASAGEPLLRVDGSGGYTGLGYLNDLQTVGSSCTDFQLVLEKIVEEFGEDNVIVFAHSMGSQLVDYIFAGCPYGAKPWDKSKVLNSVVLAAPDIDVHDFESHLDTIRETAKHFTIYASANDAALRASQEARGKRRRLGQGGPERFLASGLMTIDATAVENGSQRDPQNHSYVFEVPEVKRDISDLLRGRFDPNLRDCPQPYTDTASNIAYWELQPGCTR